MFVKAFPPDKVDHFYGKKVKPAGFVKAELTSGALGRKDRDQAVQETLMASSGNREHRLLRFSPPVPAPRLKPS